MRAKQRKDEGKKKEKARLKNILLYFSLGRTGALEHYFHFLFLSQSPFFLPRSLHHPFTLSPQLSPPTSLAPPSLSLWDIFKVKPFGQSASCRDLHRCFSFSFSACVLGCVCVKLPSVSSMCVQVEHFELTPHRAHTLPPPTHTHAHA